VKVDEETGEKEQGVRSEARREKPLGLIEERGSFNCAIMK
jgi:hypothetical protein